MRKEESSEDIKTKLYWFAFQQQFQRYLCRIISFTNGKLSYTQYPETDPSCTQLMRCEANMQIPFVASEDVSVPLQFYFGPNHYKTLNLMIKGLRRLFHLEDF